MIFCIFDFLSTQYFATRYFATSVGSAVSIFRHFNILFSIFCVPHSVIIYFSFRYIFCPEPIWCKWKCGLGTSKHWECRVQATPGARSVEVLVCGEILLKCTELTDMVKTRYRKNERKIPVST